MLATAKTAKHELSQLVAETLLRQSEVIEVQVVTIDMSSIGIKFENFMQAGCRDQGLHPGSWTTLLLDMELV